jgi:TetR/AcrR family transcriptional regulator, transcriptional repressor for nem operon
VVKAPATPKGQRSRNLITATAAELMHDRGIGATSLDDVLAASGTGKSQLYHYFRGKEELTGAVLEYQFERIMAAQPSLTDESCADLSRWRREVLDANREHRFAGCPLGTFAGQVDGSDPLRALFADLFARWRAALAALVARAQRAGRAADGTDPDDAALVLLGALQGGAMLSRVHGAQEALERMLDTALASVG